MQAIGKFTTFARPTADAAAINKIVSENESIISKTPDLAVVDLLRSTKQMTIHDVILEAAKYNVAFQFDGLEAHDKARVGFGTSFDEIEAALAIAVEIGLATRFDETPAEFFERTKN